VYLLTFTLKRILAAVPILFGLVTLVFFLARLLPGDATILFLSPQIPHAVVEQLKIEFGLDLPLWQQYVHWLRETFQGNLGYSFSQGAPVTEVLLRVFPNTFLLGTCAVIVEVIFGISLAAIIFLLDGKLVEKAVAHGLVVGSTIPPFWIGLLLLIVFSYWLGLLPSSHMFSSGTEPSGATTGDLVSHLFLPVLTLALPASAGFARYLRASIKTVMAQDFVLLARSMGLSNSRVFRSYILPNAISPMVSLLGVEIGVLMGGVLVTETLFAWPGMGRLTINAIASRDYPLIIGCTLVAGMVVMAGTLLADLVNAMIDPRVRNIGNAQ
jgi:peptide/nickel transport system permease protein